MGTDNGGGGEGRNGKAIGLRKRKEEGKNKEGARGW